MDTLNNIWFYIALMLGIVLLHKMIYEYVSRSLKKRKALERARFVKDIRTEVRKYLQELKS